MGGAARRRAELLAVLSIYRSLRRELGDASVDVVFIDAVKTEYPEYVRLVKPMVAAGGLLIMDNALGSGGWWIDEHAEAEHGGVLLITHYTRILRYIKPQFVHVFYDGRIITSGGPELADELEENGYERYTTAAAGA